MLSDARDSSGICVGNTPILGDDYADVGCLLRQERMKMQERVFSTEAVMLRAFGFVLHVEHPHKFVLSLLLLLGLDGPILQEAWNLTNDRYFTFP